MGILHEPGPLPTAPAGSSSANDGVNTGPEQDLKEEKDKVSLVTSYQSAQAGRCSDVASGHGSLEEVSFAKRWVEMRGESGCTRRDRKTKVSCLPSWPLTVQAWTSFRAKDAVQTLRRVSLPWQV